MKKTATIVTISVAAALALITLIITVFCIFNGFLQKQQEIRKNMYEQNMHYANDWYERAIETIDSKRNNPFFDELEKEVAEQNAENQ